MKWLWRSSNLWAVYLIYLTKLLEASFLNFGGGGTCSCARPCPPPPACPTSYGPCPASCFRPTYSGYSSPSYAAYPSSGYYPSGYAIAYPAGYVETSPSYVAAVGAGGSYSAPTVSYIPSVSTYSSHSSYSAPPATSVPSSSSYAVPQMAESSGYVYVSPNQTPYTYPNSYYTYAPALNKSYYNSGTATVNPQTSFADSEPEEEEEGTKEEFKTMPFVDVSYKSKQLAPERQLSAPSIETVAYEAPSVCNNQKIGEAMLKAMVPDISISKRLVRSSTELAFPGKKFDVFCATGDFSYSIYAEQYCEATRGNVTCFAFY